MIWPLCFFKLLTFKRRNRRTVLIVLFPKIHLISPNPGSDNYLCIDEQASTILYIFFIIILFFLCQQQPGINRR